MIDYNFIVLAHAEHQERNRKGVAGSPANGAPAERF